MIFEGLKLMVVGMTTVLLFLMFMILLIQFVAYLTRDITAREIQAIEEEKARLKREKEERARLAQAADDSDEDIVVISAAIAAFEAERAAVS
ncbi:MAG: sodium pump decarboxylase subunit gamma [Desulfobacterales bacterium]|nr:MAG: sodium pump decarboxylase subunit gamma [Desulfobacterales bacterium]